MADQYARTALSGSTPQGNPDEFESTVDERWRHVGTSWSDPAWRNSPPRGVFRLRGRTGIVYYRIFARGPIWHNSVTEKQHFWWDLVEIESPLTEAVPDDPGQQALFEPAAGAA